jgi:hypothetical protein
MLGVALIFLLPIGLAFCWRSLSFAARDRWALVLIMAGYAARLAMSEIVHTFPFFSYGSGGDSYEVAGNIIARMWNFSGAHYVTSDEFPDLGPTTLPPNLFALVAFANQGPTHIGCVAVVAALGCITALNIYAMAHTLGCRHVVALRVLAVVTFLPTFVFYTSDTNKDGLVAFFVFAVFGSAVRLSRRFSFTHAAIGLAGLAALWPTRYYLVFVLWVPFAIGLLGMGAKSFLRTATVVTVISMGALAALAHSRFLSDASETATEAYSRGTSEDSMTYNAKVGGSGVLITGSGPSALAQKLAYAIFAPFPWQSGSIGMQLAKIEMFVWYYFSYRAIAAVRMLWRKRRSDLVLFGLFIAPTMAMYTSSFSNVGLALRERMHIVLAMLLLASFSWGISDREAGADEEEDSPDPPVPELLRGGIMLEDHRQRRFGRTHAQPKRIEPVAR